MKTKKSQEKSDKLGYAPNVSAAAVTLSVPPAAVHAARSQGCKAIRRNGNVDCDELSEWFADRPGFVEKFSDVPSKALEDAYKARANRQLAEIEVAEKRKELWNRDEIKRDCAKYVNAMKNRLYASVTNITTSTMVDLKLTAEQAQLLRDTISREHVEVLRAFQAGTWFKEESK
jgi:hypothetical protein